MKSFKSLLCVYVLAAYVYSVAFLCAQQERVEPLQLLFVLLSPLLWPVHMGLVVMCTIFNPGGRGSWDATNTAAIVPSLITTAVSFAWLHVVKKSDEKEAASPK